MKTIIIGVAGASASGKTLIADTIYRELGSADVTVLPEDAYYKNNTHLTFEERCDVNYDHPNALDHSLLCEHLDQLSTGKGIDIPVYDFTQHLRSDETRHVGPHRIIVLEGILIFADPDVLRRVDIRIFMDTALDICLLRRAKRDVLERDRSLESVLGQYEATVRPMYYQFIEPSKRHADIIVPRGGANRIAIDMIKTQIKALIKSGEA